MNETAEKQYLLQLGRHPVLSRAELAGFCDEVAFWGNKNVLKVENLKVKNPRNLPKSEQQLFLDRFGGVIAMAEVMLESDNVNDVYDEAAAFLGSLSGSDTRVPVSLRFMGVPNAEKKDLLKDFGQGLAKKKDSVYRWLNQSGQNLEFGRIFNDKVLKKGIELWIYKQKDRWGVAKLVALQNLRNYTLRDHKKPFRDSKMGMLPPKVAQMLINLAKADENKHIIVDPFCGSGTVCTEAAIMGYQAIGSDLDAGRVTGATENNRFLSEKFRYDEAKVTLEDGDASKRSYKGNQIIVTEGFLGLPFSQFPSKDEVWEQAETILRIWGKVLNQAKKGNVPKIVLCIPAWKLRTGGHAQISEKLLAQAERVGYHALDLFAGELTTLYARPEAFVARQVIVLSADNLG